MLTTVKDFIVEKIPNRASATTKHCKVHGWRKFHLTYSIYSQGALLKALLDKANTAAPLILTFTVVRRNVESQGFFGEGRSFDLTWRNPTNLLLVEYRILNTIFLHLRVK